MSDINWFEGLDWEEISPSPKLTISRSSGQASDRIFKVAADDLDQFLDAITGDIPGTSGSTATPPVSNQYPDRDWMTVQQLVVEPFSPDIAADGQELTAANEDINTYSYYKVSCTYQTDYTDSCVWPNYQETNPDLVPPSASGEEEESGIISIRPEFRAGTVLKLKITGSEQFMTVPNRSMVGVKGNPDPKSAGYTPGFTIGGAIDIGQTVGTGPGGWWGGAASGAGGAVADWLTGNNKKEEKPTPLPPSEKGRLFIPLADFRLTWDYVDDPPLDRLRDMMGHVNESYFLGSPPGCLLFESYEIDHSFRCRNSDPRTWKVEIVLKERKIVSTRQVTSTDSSAASSTTEVDIVGWNYILDAKKGWIFQVSTYDGRPLYPISDFTDLLK